jgi:hyperosmotically inducible protein
VFFTKGSGLLESGLEVEAVQRKWILTALAAGTLAIAGISVGQGQQPAADNTKANKTEKSTSADKAKNNEPDRTTMQKIREAIMADKSLSTYAHNVKIISQNGKVTLKGPVRSEEEKKSIEQKATDVAGAGNVTNEITIKPPKGKKTTN